MFYRVGRELNLKRGCFFYFLLSSISWILFNVYRFVLRDLLQVLPPNYQSLRLARLKVVSRLPPTSGALMSVDLYAGCSRSLMSHLGMCGLSRSPQLSFHISQDRAYLSCIFVHVFVSYEYLMRVLHLVSCMLLWLHYVLPMTVTLVSIPRGLHCTVVL
jgi:hypothetical protein